jgi:hypothetical protein
MSNLLYILKKCINKYRARILFICWGNLEVSLLTLFCSLMLLTDGCGGMSPMVISLFVVRNILTMLDARNTADISYLVWHKQIPLKVSMLARRFLCDKLPTKDNLMRRHVIPLDASLCVTRRGGCGDGTPSVPFMSGFCTLVESRSILD